MTTPVTLAIIQALIPLGLKAVEDALVREVTALAGARFGRTDADPEVVRYGAQRGSIYLADQKRPIQVPRVRDRGRSVKSRWRRMPRSKRPAPVMSASFAGC